MEFRDNAGASNLRYTLHEHCVEQRCTDETGKSRPRIRVRDDDLRLQHLPGRQFHPERFAIINQNTVDVSIEPKCRSRVLSRLRKCVNQL